MNESFKFSCELFVAGLFIFSCRVEIYFCSHKIYDNVILKAKYYVLFCWMNVS